MDKELILQTIKNAKNVHNNMFENINLLMDGLDLRFESCPKDPKECEFGQWFYGDGQKLQALSNNPMECMRNIELLHNEFHKLYHEIVEKFQKKSKKEGFFQKIFSKKEQSQTDQEQQEITSLYQQLQNAHAKLLAEFEKMQRRIQATSAEKFQNI